MFDLLETEVDRLNRAGDADAARDHAARLRNPAVIQAAKAARPAGTGLRRGDWEGSVVVSADNVVRYLSEHQLGEAELAALLSNIALVPGHERMFVEARCLGYGMLAKAHAFGWTVQREDDGQGGWLMTTGLILEWRKGVPIGPIGLVEWKLDHRGRFIADDPSRPELCQAQFPMIPDQPGVLEPLCESLMAMADGTAGVLALTLGMMHCKNVMPTVVTAEPKQSRRHARRYGQPLTRYHVLDIQPMMRTLERDGRARQDGLAAALHRCRGHFKTFRPEAPLFGKLTGQYWWNDHDRGDRNHGTVASAYRVHPPDVPDAVGRVYEGRLAQLLPHESRVEDQAAGPAARAQAAHDAIQDQLAAALEHAGITPLRPAPHEPQYDLGWERDGELWIAEVKSTTETNEVQQVRAAIGQVLHYRSELAARHSRIKTAIVTEHPVRNNALVAACHAAGIVLTSAAQVHDFVRAEAAP